MSEENRANEANQAAGESGTPQAAAGETKTVDELLDQHVHRWQQRAQVIVAVIAAFLLYMIYFMMHE